MHDPLLKLPVLLATNPTDDAHVQRRLARREIRLLGLTDGRHVIPQRKKGRHSVAPSVDTVRPVDQFFD